MVPMPPFPVVEEKTHHSWEECKSWDDFKSRVLPGLFNGEVFHRGVYLFRGQSSFRFPLKPSFDRWFSGERSEKKAVSERLLSFFREEIEGLTVDPTLVQDRSRLLALAQHHGVPTRLLDWSESPYIAAFFAFEGLARLPQSDPPTYAAIWCLDLRKKNVWDSEAGAQVLHVPGYGNERLRKQLGWFTLLNAPFDTLEEYVTHFKEADEALQQFQIPAGDVMQVLADLEMMGITFSTIYPGIDGSAKTAELRARRELLSKQPKQPKRRKKGGKSKKVVRLPSD